MLCSLDVSYSIDAQQGLAYISGKVEPHNILRMLGKAGKHVRLSHVHYGNQTPARLDNCYNINLTPHRNIDYGCYHCGKIDDYEYGNFDGCRFDLDYRYGRPLSTMSRLNHRCRQYYEIVEQHSPSPIFDNSGYDLNTSKVKECSCCHIM